MEYTSYKSIEVATGNITVHTLSNPTPAETLIRTMSLLNNHVSVYGIIYFVDSSSKKES